MNACGGRGAHHVDVGELLIEMLLVAGRVRRGVVAERRRVRTVRLGRGRRRVAGAAAERGRRRVQLHVTSEVRENDPQDPASTHHGAMGCRAGYAGRDWQLNAVPLLMLRQLVRRRRVAEGSGRRVVVARHARVRPGTVWLVRRQVGQGAAGQPARARARVSPCTTTTRVARVPGGAHHETTTRVMSGAAGLELQ